MLDLGSKAAVRLEGRLGDISDDRIMRHHTWFSSFPQLHLFPACPRVRWTAKQYDRAGIGIPDDDAFWVPWDIEERSNG